MFCVCGHLLTEHVDDDEGPCRVLGCNCEVADEGLPADPGPRHLTRDGVLETVSRALRAAYPDGERAAQVFAAFQREIPDVLDVAEGTMVRIQGRMCTVKNARWVDETNAIVEGIDTVSLIVASDTGANVHGDDESDQEGDEGDED